MTLTEWIFSKLPTIDKDDPYYRDIIEQAKKLEKDQTMDVCCQCGSKGNELKQINQDNYMTRGSTALVRVTLSQTEISDEEIAKSMSRYNITDFGQMAAYVTGAKWYREQLKKR